MVSQKRKLLLILKGAGCTFYFGFEVWIFVEHCHLFLPVKFIPPVGDYFLKIRGIEAILEARILQRLSIASPVDALMKVLLKKENTSYCVICCYNLLTLKGLSNS